MKKLIALGIFLSLAVCGCETNRTQPSSPKDESPRVLPSARPVGPGKATFQKKGGELETFDITVHDRGHKNFYGEGSAPVIIIDWSDGYSSAYLFRPDDGGLVYDYDPKTKKWKYSGSEMRWAYKGENVSITSENGAKTVLGGVKKKLEPMIGAFINVQKKQAAANAVRERKRKMYTDLNLEQLDTEFKQNRIRARRNYEGKVMTVRGQIDAIYDDKMTVCQEASGECITLPYGYYLKDSLRNWLAEREQGERVTVTGTLEIEVSMGQPLFGMDNWRIVSGYTDAPLSIE